MVGLVIVYSRAMMYPCVGDCSLECSLRYLQGSELGLNWLLDSKLKENLSPLVGHPE